MFYYIYTFIYLLLKHINKRKNHQTFNLTYNTSHKIPNKFQYSILNVKGTVPGRLIMPIKIRSLNSRHVKVLQAVAC